MGLDLDPRRLQGGELVLLEREPEAGSGKAQVHGSSTVQLSRAHPVDRVAQDGGPKFVLENVLSGSGRQGDLVEEHALYLARLSDGHAVAGAGEHGSGPRRKEQALERTAVLCELQLTAV